MRLTQGTRFGIGGNEPLVASTNVLLVDDSPAQRQLVRISLESSPEFRIIAEASDGAEAVARAQEWQPDLILLDLHMPVMGGLEALPKLLLASPRSSIIVLSDSDKTEVESAVIERGAAGFIPKAADPNQLPTAIAHILQGSGAPLRISRPRILVAGYDAQTRDAVTDGLADQLNAFVVDSHGGDDALEKLRTAPFGMIVSGNQIQGMDGTSFLERSNAVAHETPRIMFARPNDPSIEAQANEAGAALCVSRLPAAPDRSIRNLAQKTRRLLFAESLSQHRKLQETGFK